MIRRNRLVNAAMLAWLAGWLVALYALMPVDPIAAARPHATPSGAIADPITGTPHPTGWLAPAIHSHHKHPPREHLTMPPTDTEH